MKKILVIEDDFFIGEFVEMALTARYDVNIQKDSGNLVEVLSEFKPDLILMDNWVGQKNAEQIVAQITANGYQLTSPLILFSANPDIKEIAARIGAIDFLAKPFELDDLYNCISRNVSSIQMAHK